MRASHCYLFRRGMTNRRCLYLDDTDTDSEKKERKPLGRAQFFAKERDGKCGSCQDFHLIRNLERGDGEITDCDELEGVLHDVEDGWDGELPTVSAEYFAT
jgi:hypothetical protein